MNKSCALALLFLILIFGTSLVSAATLPTVGSDNGTWGTVLNDYLNTSLGENATSLNVSSGYIRGNLNVTGTVYGTSNNSDYLGGYLPSFFMPLNTSVYGNFDFNGGWQNGGISINNGDIYAHTGYFYNITSLNVTKQNLTINDNFVTLGNANVGGNFSVNANNLFVNSNLGTVGINTTNPQRALDVQGDSVLNGNLISNLDNGIYIGRTGLSENQWELGNRGVTWTTKDSSRTWNSIAMSSDGKYQTAVVKNGYIYVSSDYGNTWTAEGSSGTWIDVAMSSDGKYQTATDGGGAIYASSDYGQTWTVRDSSGKVWWYVAISADGKYQTATVDNGQLYVSSDYGQTWSVGESTNRNWWGVAMSSDGKYQTAAANDLYISSDYGHTWTAKGSVQNWREVAMSSNGKYQTATVFNGVGSGQIYVSSDYGNTWTAEDSSNKGWYPVAMSSDGKYQTAAVYQGDLYTSSNYGVNWTDEGNNKSWAGIATSSDGKYQTAVPHSDQIYVSFADSFIPYGNVGIGTDSPLAPLDLKGSLSGTNNVININDSFGDGNYINFAGFRKIGIYSGGNFFMGYNFDYNKSIPGYQYETAGPAAGVEFTTTGDIKFRTASSGTVGSSFTPTDQMIIYNNGTVDVNGVVHSTTEYQEAYNASIGASVATFTTADDLNTIESKFSRIYFFANTSAHASSMVIDTADLSPGNTYEMGKYSTRYIVLDAPSSGTSNLWGVEYSGVTLNYVRMKGIY